MRDDGIHKGPVRVDKSRVEWFIETRTAMDWLSQPEFSGIQMHDFRPGWTSILQMHEEIMDREEFRRRLAQTKHAKKGGPSLVQTVIE